MNLMDYKKTLHKISIVFLVILITFTFFSQTLTDLRIARVTLGFREVRTVIPEVHSSGTVAPLNTKMFFAPADGTIIQIAEPGYQGLSASVLFIIHSDLQGLHDRLTQAQDEQRRIAFNMERVRNDQAFERQRINQLLADSSTDSSLLFPSLHEYDFQLTVNLDQLEIARRELAEQERLYSQGIASRQSVIERENAVASLELARDQLLARREIAEERQAEQSARHLAEQDRSREAQLQLHRAAISQLDVQLRIHSMEAERVAERIYELSQQIDDGGIIEVLSGDNRTVLEHKVIEGARISEGTPIMMTALRDGWFRVIAGFGQNIPYITGLQERRPAYIHYGTMEDVGHIARIFPDGDRIMVAIDVHNTRFVGGERALVRIQGPGARGQQVIPRSALRMDNNGYYMLYVVAEERLFGISYYARVHRIEGVYARGIDGYVATMLPFGGSPLDAPIIFNSDVPVLPGDRVRPVEVGEFFDTR